MVFEQNAFSPKDLACCFWPRLCKADYSLIILCFIICENAVKKEPLGVVMMVIMTRLKENYEDWRKKDD